MAKKPESDPEQYRRFLEKVKELEDAGRLSPTEAEVVLDKVVRRGVPVDGKKK